MSAVVAVVFDWAGTMIDFGSRAPAQALARVFAAEGVAVDEPTIRRYMGMAKREHVTAILSEPAMAARWVQAKGADWGVVDVDRLMAALEPAMRIAAAACTDLIPGAAETARALMARGIKLGSTTGYTRTMMAPIIPAAAGQGYAPKVIICAGETPQGRPAPLMLWRALAELQAWPVTRCVAVDDAPVGIEAGANAGMWTVGLAGSGNGVGLSLADWQALSALDQDRLMAPVIQEFTLAGADFVIASVADLHLALAEIETAVALGGLPGQTATRLLLSGAT
jgi:phosphonoacetaldehyde hydrolase